MTVPLGYFESNLGFFLLFSFPTFLFWNSTMNFEISPLSVLIASLIIPSWPFVNPSDVSILALECLKLPPGENLGQNCPRSSKIEIPPSCTSISMYSS